VASIPGTTVTDHVETCELRQQREIHLYSRNFVIGNQKLLQFLVVHEEIAWNELDAISVRPEGRQFWHAPKQLRRQHLDLVFCDAQDLEVYQVTKNIIRQSFDEVKVQAERPELGRTGHLPSLDILEATAADVELYELWKLPRGERKVWHEGHICVLNFNCVDVRHERIVQVAGDGRDASVGCGWGEFSVEATMTAGDQKIFLKIIQMLKIKKIKFFTDKNFQICRPKLHHCSLVLWMLQKMLLKTLKLRKFSEPWCLKPSCGCDEMERTEKKTWSIAKKNQRSNGIKTSLETEICDESRPWPLTSLFVSRLYASNMKRILQICSQFYLPFFYKLIHVFEIF
jgi:hypothetical protein